MVEVLGTKQLLELEIQDTQLGGIGEHVKFNVSVSLKVETVNRMNECIQMDAEEYLGVYIRHLIQDGIKYREEQKQRCQNGR